ncbi:MAG: PEP-CTERM sorting domain-containing protein [Verrucomicrobiota bacterium]
MKRSIQTNPFLRNQAQTSAAFKESLPSTAVSSTALAILSLVVANSAFGTTFTLSSNSTTAQTLGSGASQTGTVNANKSLTVSGTTVAVTISGNNETLTNLGTISQTGTGRVIRDNVGVTGLVINNGSSSNSVALMQAADADVIQMNKTAASVTLNNYGTMTSLNATKGGSQAVDFTAILSGSNTINNYSTGILQASEADAARPGVSGVVNNAGLIKSTWATSSSGNSSDGVDAQNNSGVNITNANNWSSGSPTTPGSGTIQGARSGIAGGALNGDVTFTTSITNNLGGTIQGDNGSGINLDGFNANQSATVVNNGTITGNGRNIGDSLSHDGDGIDVDGLVFVTNTGIIRSVNSYNILAAGVAHSEGITVGGGTITNSGTIEGLVAVGNTNAIGFGITLLGNDSLTIPGTREAIYGNATVTNNSGGLIRGDSSSGIFVDGPASGYTVTINNNAGATIRGGATLAGLGGSSAAIFTGADNDTITNAGTIDGSSNGKAIEMGAGNNTLNITGGAASISGSISGGVGGTNALNINPGAGQSFSYSSAISNFNTVAVQSGTVTFTGTNTYSGATTISGSGTLALAASGLIDSTSGVALGTAGTFDVSAKSGYTVAVLTGSGSVVGALTVSTNLAIGNSPGTVNFSSDLTLGATSTYSYQLVGSSTVAGSYTAGTADLGNISASLILTAGSILDLQQLGTYTANDKFTLFGYTGTETGTFKFGGVAIADDTTFTAADGIWKINYNDTTAGLNGGTGTSFVTVTAVPEPNAASLVGGLGVLALLRRRRSPLKAGMGD